MHNKTNLITEFLNSFRIHISNIFGTILKRKIIVFESDDWGSVRTYSSEAFKQMVKAGLSVDKNHYGFDSLESNLDLENLFNLLMEFKDSTARTPVFTAFCNTANPSFKKIATGNYEKYYYDTLPETVEYYPSHDKLLKYWKEGETQRLFCPQLHGREHIHVDRWWQLLNSGDEGMRLMFENKSVGADSFNGIKYPNYLGALHPTKKSEIPTLHKILSDSGRLYEEYLGHKPEAFVAPNAEEPAELEKTLKILGINTITRAKIRKYPIGDKRFKTEFNWLGKVNRHGQVILVRNAFFEPVCFGEPDKAHITDWVSYCLKQIHIAFQWKKPAVISTHRVNYIGFINPKNGDRGIFELRRLLKAILKKWPDVEFMTSYELSKILKS